MQANQNKLLFPLEGLLFLSVFFFSFLFLSLLFFSSLSLSDPHWTRIYTHISNKQSALPLLSIPSSKSPLIGLLSVQPHTNHAASRVLTAPITEPPRAPCHSHTLAPGQKGSGRGRPTDWVRAAASREGSVDSWKLLLEGFALGLRDCRSAAQDARPGLTL